MCRGYDEGLCTFFSGKVRFATAIATASTGPKCYGERMTNHAIDDVLWKEALGDASNFKGTDYHLLYAVWLLLCRRNAPLIRFFTGNDILVTSAAPISPETEESKSVQLIVASTAELDEWIQLKSTCRPWTVSKILEGNLLSNFVCNTVSSDSKNKSWKVRLVTNQEIRAEELRSFAENPGTRAKCSKALNAMITRLRTVLPRYSEAVILQRSLQIIKHIAEGKPVHRDTLIAEINEALGRQFAGDRELAMGASRRIRAALLEDASSSPPIVHVYDLEWLSKITGHDFTTLYPLNESILNACDRQVASHNDRRPNPFSANLCIAREGPDTALNQFLQSESPLFVLTGPSGIGKSWTLMKWASQTLKSRPRVFLTRPDILDLSLESLVHFALAPLAPPTMSDRVILSKLCAAGNSESGPAVIVIDDLRPDTVPPVRCASALERIVRNAQSEGLKLVISCQTDLVRNLHPFSHVPASLIFDPTPQNTKTSDSTDSDPSPSYSMLVFSDDELQWAVQRRLGGPSPDVMALLLRDRTYAELRHPYTFDVVFSAEHVAAADVLDTLRQRGLSRLIDDRIEKCLREAVKSTGVDLHYVQLAFTRVVELLGAPGKYPRTRKQVADVVTAAVGNDGEIITHGLAHCGLLSFGPTAEIPDVHIQARLFAKLIHSQNLTVSAISERLSEADSELVSALVASAGNPAQFAADLVQIDRRWIGPAAEGLVVSDRTSDPHVHATLLGLARQESGSWDAADALGRLALRSGAARKDLVRRFISNNEGDRNLAQRAFWSVARYAPNVVIRAVQLRFRLSPFNRLAAIQSSRKRDDLRAERRSLGRAVRVLESIDSKAAADQILRFLPKIESLASDASTEDAILFAASDPLLDEYDQTRVVASSFADPEGFRRFLADLRSDDLLKRVRAVNALEAVAHLRRDDVSQTVIECLQYETDPVLLSRLLWQAYPAAQHDPDAVMRALSRNPERLWVEYGSAAAALSLLEVLLPLGPHNVLGILPEQFSMLPVETRALLGELTALVRIHAAWFDEASFLADLVLESTEQNAERRLQLLEFHQLRAKAAASMLSGIADSKIADWPLIWRHRIGEGLTDFFMIRFGSWTGKPDFESLPDSVIAETIKLLIDAVGSSGKHQAHVLQRWLRQVRVLLACDCINVLVALASRTGKLSEVIAQLPNDWERLFAINQFLKSGTPDEALLNIAFSECESKRNTRSAQASREMNRFEVYLNRFVPHLVSRVKEPRSHFSFLISAEDHSEKLAAAFDDALDAPVAELERRFAEHSQLVDVVSWNAKARYCHSVLISEPYSRMCTFNELTPTDARRLARGCALGASAFPNCVAAVEKQQLYSAIDGRFGGQVTHVPTIRDSPNVIVQSHCLASEILHAADISPERLRRVLMDRRGWQEYWNYRWADDGTIQNGFGAGFHLLLFFPAVRLALCAVGVPVGWKDPGFTWMSERRRAAREIGNSTHRDFSPAERQNEIHRFRHLLVELPDQDIIRAHIGFLLLLDGGYAEAQQQLKSALESPLCVDESRRPVLYNLACAEARLGNEAACCAALTESISSNTTRKQLEEDEDFQSMRTTEWFQALCAALKS